MPLFNNTVTCHIKDLYADMKSVNTFVEVYVCLKMDQSTNVHGLVILFVQGRAKGL